MKSNKFSSNVAGLALAGLAAACSGGGIHISAEGPDISGFPPGAHGTLQFSQTSYDATEGTIVNIIVNRSGGSSGTATVDYTTANGAAIGGSDYDAASGTLSWPNGWFGNRTISIRITDDDIAEDSESFTVTLSNVSGTTLSGATSATVNITDNDTTAIKATGMITTLTDVAVNGVRYDTTTARVTVNGWPAVISDLRTGQVVTLAGEVNLSNATGSAEEIGYTAMLIGPVEEVDETLDQLTVMGQTVLTNAEIVLDSANVDDLSAGDIVEVSGFADTAGAIHATRIDRGVTIAKHQLIGTVAELDLGNLSFAVNSLTLDYSNAIVVDLPGGAPFNGMTIKAIGTMNRGVFVVEQLTSVPDLAVDLGDRVQAAGLMTRYDATNDFEIGSNAFSITADTTYLNGDMSKLSSDDVLLVDGEFSGNGPVTAKRITFGRHNDQTQTVVDYQGGIEDQ